MLSPLICGSFKHQEEDELYISPCLTSPRTSRKTNNKDIKNPFSPLGLNKFSALLADLEEKKQKIYLQRDSQNISLVLFVYSSSNEVVPVVVKSKDKKQAKGQKHIKQDKPTTPNSAAFDNKYSIESSSRVKDIKEPCLEAEKKAKKINLDNLRHPSYYVPAAIILILVVLTVFGRSVAILLTSLGWYIVPTITGDTLKSKKKKKKQRKKKELVRKFSEIKMVSDGIASAKKENNDLGAVENASRRE